MGVFHFLWNFFFGSFEWLIAFIKEWFLQASESGFTPNIGSLIMLTILLVFGLMGLFNYFINKPLLEISGAIDKLEKGDFDLDRKSVV